MSNVYYRTLLEMDPSPSVVAAVYAAKYGIPTRRCRWWVKRHRWQRHDPVVVAGLYHAWLTHCDRCHQDRIVILNDIAVAENL